MLKRAPIEILSLAMLLASLCLVQASQAAMDPRFVLDTRALAGSAGKTAPSVKNLKRRAPSVGVRPSRQARRVAGKKASPKRAVVKALPPKDQGYWSSEQRTLQQLTAVWDKLIPFDAKVRRPLSLVSPTFSLTLDPGQYPLYMSMDGFLILVDRKNSLPPMVKALIEEKDASVRIVNESPANGRRFWSAMLYAARFYSLEENFSIEFGRDPKLTVNSDFKIEKEPDSVMNGNVLLLNHGRVPLSSTLKSFLAKNGFTVYETELLFRPVETRTPLTIKQIANQEQPLMAGAILKALGVPAGRARAIDVFAGDDNGVRLSVRADYTFVHDGETFLVCYFDGDPANRALLRSLEERGYRVVLLDTQDDFYRTAAKILSAMRIRASYQMHDLVRDKRMSISLQMSGFLLDDPLLAGGRMLLTNSEIDGTIRALLSESGFGLDRY